jgi:hypothetical protein
MSQENVDIVRGQFDATTRRDFAAAVDAFDEQVVLVVDADAVHLAAGPTTAEKPSAHGSRTGSGPSRTTASRSRRFGVSVSECSLWTHHARGRASGVKLDWSIAYAYSLRSAKIVRMEMYNSRAKALEVVGLEG